MTNTYVAATIYHIYLALIHIIKRSGYQEDNYGNNLLFIVESTPFIERLIPNLKKGFFREVYVLSDRKKQKNGVGKWNYALRRKSKIPAFLEAKHPELVAEKEFIRNSNLFLCECDSAKSYFLYEFGKTQTIAMIEDGARTYSKRHSKLEGWTKTYITKTPIGGGYDREIKTLYAQFPEKLPEALQKKAVELNIKKEVAKFSTIQKERLFETFINTAAPELPKHNNALILTQPISEDGLVTEAVKIEIYKDVIAKVPQGLNIILKTHPREKTAYQEYFKDIIVLPGLFPIEILGLKEGFHFTKGYTLFSTALNNLEIVDQGYFMGKDYIDKFASTRIKELILNVDTHA